LACRPLTAHSSQHNLKNEILFSEIFLFSIQIWQPNWIYKAAANWRISTENTIFGEKYQLAAGI
jgi:hypothetical protein